jgi:hypothetical protein
MNYTVMIIVMILILAFGGCGGTVGKKFNTSKVENIINGTTTQAEIKNIFGKPFKTGIQNGKPIWVYEYNRYNLLKNKTSKDLIIIFGSSGVVQSHQFMSNEPSP